jgi:hypothetical protein
LPDSMIAILDTDQLSVGSISQPKG